MKLKKILALFLIILLIILENISYGKYVYNFDETIVKLTRETNPPICNVTYSTEEWTNQNVVITITSNKEVQQVSGFELSKDKKILTKVAYVNESDTVIVRDLSGNSTEIEYNVSNIDKEPPQIIGCENGKIYEVPLILDYSDNGEIKDIIVEHYNNNLKLAFHKEYCDSVYYKNTDRSSETLTINVEEHPINTRKYKYYINDQLYTTTSDTCYTFTGLNKGTEYTIKVEALDADGNVLESTTQEAKTSYYELISSTKTSNMFWANLVNIDSSVANIKYAVWNYYDESNIKWHDAIIEDGKSSIICKPFDQEKYPSYVINTYLYDSSGNVLDIVEFSIDFNTNYVAEDSKENRYELKKSGNYQIIVTDFAQNETIYYIKVE